jgi:hypothetical protein
MVYLVERQRVDFFSEVYVELQKMLDLLWTFSCSRANHSKHDLS